MLLEAIFRPKVVLNLKLGQISDLQKTVSIARKQNLLVTIYFPALGLAVMVVSRLSQKDS